MATKAKKDFYKEYVNRMEKHGGYNNLVVLLRMGDFYETYDESAERCAAVLGLTMAETLKSDNKYHTMVGFPASKRDEYVSVMIGECYRVVVVEPDYEMVYHRDAHGKLVIIRNNNNSTTINNNQNQATMEKNFKFKSVSTVNRYMFNPEMQALVEVSVVKEVFNLNNGKCSQEWRVANTDKVMKTCYTPATEEQPEQFDGKVYRSLVDFEHDAPLPIGDVFNTKGSERDVCAGLFKNGYRFADSDEKGAYVWTFLNGEAVKWYFREHIDEVTWNYSEKGQIKVTSDYEGELPQPYHNSEEVYQFNDYRFIDENGKEVVREGMLKRLLLESDQQALVEKLQAVIDECNKADITIYWSNADYTLNAVSRRKIDRIEYDPNIDEETEEAYYFDDSRAAHTFKNVGEINSEDSDVKFVIKKEAGGEK